MRGFKSFASAERFCRSHDQLRDFLRLRTRHNHHVPASRRRPRHPRPPPPARPPPPPPPPPPRPAAPRAPPPPASPPSRQRRARHPRGDIGGTRRTSQAV